jgi:type I restriction enzyme, S subunit
VKLVRLGKIAKVDRVAATANEREFLPYVGLDDIEKDRGGFADQFRRKPEKLLAAKFKFSPRHVLYGKLRPYLNKVALPDFVGVCTTEILPLLADESVLERGYLFALLLSPKFVAWASQNTSGANLPRLDPKLLIDYEVPLLPLPEQKRIAAILEKADHLRRTRRYARQLSDIFLQSVFLEMFGDPLAPVVANRIARLGDVLEVQPQNGLYVPPEQYVSRGDRSGVEMVHMADLFNGIVATGNLKRVDIGVSEKEKYALSETDLLIARRSINYEGAAKPCRIPILSAPLVFESSMIRVRPDKAEVLPLYLYYYLSHESVRRHRVRRYVTISTISGINQDGLKRIEVVVPPLALQQKFATIARRFERLRAQQREAARQAEHLFQTLLHRAFNGRD